MSSSLETTKLNDIKYLIDNLIKYPDFPKPGIVFRFVTKLLDFNLVLY